MNKVVAGGIQMVVFDYGGVLAEEGFTQGLRAIAARHGMDEDAFFATAHALIHETRYITGGGTEGGYWEAVRKRTGIGDDDETLRNEILSRFILRTWMVSLLRKLLAGGVRLAILSDQTNWLDELNARDDFFQYFDVIFNSFHLGKTKRERSHFIDIIKRLDRRPERLLFVDDTEAHCERARSLGIHAIHYTGREPFLVEMASIFPYL